MLTVIAETPASLLDGDSTVTPDEITPILRITRRELFRLVGTGQFPPPDFYLSRKIQRWRRSTIQRWMEQQEARR